ncbi:MAG: carbamoyltransferase HypF [Ignavibacteriae bacterium]|nr:carbamoyltransferase HypF [Ignavibacteriota bacterium]
MTHRIKISIKGAVQGVGFRPFIYKLAKSLGLKGYVLNTPQGVIIEAEGEHNILAEFIERIKSEKPPISLIQNISIEKYSLNNFKEFEIRKSDLRGSPNAIVLPDIATCKDCIEEICDPSNRRFLYPFTNCTNCGPRYSIIESLPYDRARTTMKKFNMCTECNTEYENPDDRRFHAQPNACPICGPHVELWTSNGRILEFHNDAIIAAAKAIKEGKIIAIKGLGGFHFVVDAMNVDSINRLRKKKNREEKPFALMYPNINLIKNDCDVTETEEKLLLSAQAPIVLLKRKDNCGIPGEVTPLNPNLGIMLPYTPLHHIIMMYLKNPIVATSGNIAEEPICIDEKDALKRLKDVTDLFLIHNRPIYRNVDDSIARIISNERVILRRARGYAPMPVIINTENKKTILSVGGHLKNTIAVSKGSEVFISQHIGDLETIESYNSFCNTIDKFQEIYEIEPDIVVSDSHPDYISSKYAKEKFKKTELVQHHVSHILSVIAENEIDGPVLGISWDGAGFGDDKTIWGGEFIRFNECGYKRIAHLKKFRLPGGESSFKEIYKSAFGLLYEIYGDDELKYVPFNISEKETGILLQMLKKNINSPECSSAGRLFDAVASILGIRRKVKFEGQAAMELEFLTYGFASEENYNFEIVKDKNGLYVIDWIPMIKQILEDKMNYILLNMISIKFHNTLVKIITEVAKLVKEKNVALSGGCFQNKYLLENSIKELLKNGFRVFWNKEVPANDGGISLGQIAYLSYFKNIK